MYLGVGGRQLVHTFSGKIAMNVFTGYIMKNGSICAAGEGVGGGGKKSLLLAYALDKAEQ